METLWGIDLGGTKIEGVLLENSNALNVIKRLRVPTEQEKGYEHIVRQVKRLVDLMCSETGIQPTCIGIGTPGAIDPPTGLLKNSNTVCLNKQPFLKDIEEILGLPVIMANDANCFAVAEAVFGHAKDAVPGAEVIFGVIMGTGVGGGVVVHNKVINGRHSIAGEWGHNFLDESGGKCYCGKSGCVETVFSGPALERYYQSLGGENLKLSVIVDRARQGSDPLAKQTLERLIYFFGKAIAVVINVLDPQAIVLGGGLSHIEELYTLGVEAARPHVFNPRIDTLFLHPKLGDSAGVFGAALLTAG